jgi:hypothetical protein
MAKRAGMAAAATVVTVWAAAMAAGCSGAGAAPGCLVDADCASGVCLADRTCGAADGASDGGLGDADGGVEGADGGAAGADGGAQACGNGDGRITRDEVTFRAGLAANFRVAADATVRLAGTTWDFAAMQAGDADARVTLEPVAGRWFAGKYPQATYATRLASDSDLLGVFQAREDALVLLGIASPQNTGLYTDVAYEPPVTVLKFPLQVGATFATNAVVSGVAKGVATYYVENYESRVDAAGQVRTPYGTFPALRVRTNRTQTVGGFVTTNKQVLFAAECFGVVASVRSNPYEASDDFTSAAELRRLAP